MREIMKTGGVSDGPISGGKARLQQKGVRTRGLFGRKDRKEDAKAAKIFLAFLCDLGVFFATFASKQKLRVEIDSASRDTCRGAPRRRIHFAH